MGRSMDATLQEPGFVSETHMLGCGKAAGGLRSRNSLSTDSEESIHFLFNVCQGSTSPSHRGTALECRVRFQFIVDDWCPFEQATVRESLII